MPLTNKELLLLAQKSTAMLAVIADGFGLGGNTSAELTLTDGSVHNVSIMGLIDEVNAASEPDNIIDFPIAKQNNNTPTNAA